MLWGEAVERGANMLATQEFDPLQRRFYTEAVLHGVFACPTCEGDGHPHDLSFDQERALFRSAPDDVVSAYMAEACEACGGSGLLREWRCRADEQERGDHAGCGWFTPGIRLEDV